MDKDNIVVFSSEMARQLLKMGFRIVDIKPDRLDEDKKRSVFVFKNDNGLKNAMHSLIDKRNL